MGLEISGMNTRREWYNIYMFFSLLLWGIRNRPGPIYIWVQARTVLPKNRPENRPRVNLNQDGSHNTLKTSEKTVLKNRPVKSVDQDSSSKKRLNLPKKPSWKKIVLYNTLIINKQNRPDYKFTLCWENGN